MRESDGDLIIAWAAQDLCPPVRVWSAGGAVAVASPGLSNHDRLALHGPVEPVVTLLETALPALGPRYRPFGPADLVTAVVERLPGLELSGEFAWMDTDQERFARAPLAARGPAAIGWLEDDAAPEVAEVLESGFPDSLARPGGSGVRRWAGARQSGELVAVAADAWSSPSVGFVSGVATRPEHRGRGFGRAVCQFLLGELLVDHSAVGLFVGRTNDAAISLYRSLGMQLRPIAAARQEGAGDRTGSPSSGGTSPPPACSR